MGVEGVAHTALGLSPRDPSDNWQYCQHLASSCQVCVTECLTVCRGVCVCAGVGVFVYLTGLNIHIDIIAMTASRDSCLDNRNQFFTNLTRLRNFYFCKSFSRYLSFYQVLFSITDIRYYLTYNVLMTDAPGCLVLFFNILLLQSSPLSWKPHVQIGLRTDSSSLQYRCYLGKLIHFSPGS